MPDRKHSLLRTGQLLCVTALLLQGCGTDDSEDEAGNATNGASCLRDSACASAACVDGVCCATTCDGLCESCAIASLEGTCMPIGLGEDPDDDCAGSDGICGGTCTGERTCTFAIADTHCAECSVCDGAGQCDPLAVDEDPNDDCGTCRTCDGLGACKPQLDTVDLKNDCPDEGDCGRNGLCDGGGACDYYDSATEYTPQFCTDVEHVVSFADHCDGSGGFAEGGVAACEPYACNGAAAVCNTTCADSGDCHPQAFCDLNDLNQNGASDECLPLQADGAPCSGELRDVECAGGECSNGFCCSIVGGVCCANDASCSVQTAATCDDATTCAGTVYAAACSAAKTCYEYPTTDPTPCLNVACAAPSCASPVWTYQNLCNAQGACTPSTVDCDDGDPCTTDTCDPDTGCIGTPSCNPTLRIVIDGGGTGTVTSLPTGIECGGTCEYGFSNSTQVTLSAVPAADAEFAGFAGSGCYDTSDCVVDMDKDRTIHARFVAKKNLVFVTSTTQTPASLGSIDGADAVCAARASDAGLSGNFVAWLSDSSTDAVDRLGAARGWVRPDGRAFVDTIADLVAGKIYYPPFLDEYGAVNLSPNLVMTGTLTNGTKSTTNCADYSSSAGNVTLGSQFGTTWNWINWAGGTCSSARLLYCLQTDFANPVTPDPVGGHVAFISSNTFSNNIGITGADNLCQTEAGNAGLSGSFQALLATSTTPAGARFSSYGAGWVRRDGVPFVATASALLGGGLPTAPLNVTADGLTYFNDNEANGYVATGAPTVTDVGVNTCTDWSTSASGVTFDRGVATTIGPKFFDRGSTRACSSSYYLYCLQDNRVNLAFTTSTTYTGAEISGIAGGNAKCNARAAAAGLPGTYVAWLSDSTTDAVQQLAGARGWIRPDGKPFADTVSDITMGSLRTPLRLDEYGAVLNIGIYAHTGTNTDGTVATGYTCSNWSSDSGEDYIGLTSAGVDVWTHKLASACSEARPLYCLGVDYDNAAYIPAEKGRVAFVSTPSLAAIGFSEADDLCQTEALDAGLDGSFLAFMATATASAASRFSASGPTWVRPDGLPVAASAVGFLTGAELLAPISLHADGTAGGSGAVITGGSHPGAVADASTSCSDWSTVSAGAIALSGNASHTDLRWFSEGTVQCDLANARIYCLEQ